MNHSALIKSGMISSDDLISVDNPIYPLYKVAVVAAVLNELGVEHDALLADTDIHPSQLDSAEVRISRRQLLQAYQNAVRLSPVPDLGLRVGRRLHVGEYGMYGYALMSSRNLREALAFAIKYHQLATPTVRMSLFQADDDDIAIFRMEDITHDERILEFNLSVQFALVLSLFEDMLGENFKFTEVQCSLNRPLHAERYTSILGCDVLFDCRYDELRFDEWWLSKTLRRANPITANMLEKTCDELLSNMLSKDDIISQVATAVTEMLEDGPGIDEVARRLNMSSRTLRRRLTDKDASYQQILQDVRSQIAIAYLRDTHMTVEDIAGRVGFTDSANFRHAFKRWTGQPPSHFRAKPAN